MTAMKSTRWWWVRHAPVTANDGRLYGASDPPADLEDFTQPHADALQGAAPERPRRALAPLVCDGRHLDARDAARHDQVEVREFGGHVQGESVPRYPLFHVNADAGDLAALRPHTRQSLIALAGNAERSDCRDERLFDRTQKPMQVLPVLAEEKDRIPNELARAMKGHVATPLDLEHVDELLGERLARCGEMGWIERAPQCDHGRVFYQQQRVAGEISADSGIGQCALVAQSFVVGHATQSDHREFRAHACPRR
jgi:hypothetical protein